ncbi:hypothetical protein [Candidatus Poriferisodalis sp.]|uniref:hypothetical protein n=1 Tax=Candidatus Poriferisodalis sp. TaxID=3101277 RepID=UPI003C6EB2F4
MALIFVAVAAAALLLVALLVRSFVGRRWDAAAIDEQESLMSEFLAQYFDDMVPTDELEAFLRRQQHPVAHYYSENAYKWAKRFLAARLPAAIAGYETRCAERSHSHNLYQWEQRATSALIDDVLRAAPEAKYVSFSELAGAKEGSKGEKWRHLHLHELLTKHGLTLGEVESLGDRIDSRVEDERNAWNRNTRQANLDAYKDLFDSLEAHPLTHAQRTAVVTDEDATLVPPGRGQARPRSSLQRSAT